MNKISNTMHKFGIKKVGLGALGITAHGLRAGYGIKKFEDRGLIPTVRAGEIGVLPKEEKYASEKKFQSCLAIHEFK